MKNRTFLSIAALACFAFATASQAQTASELMASISDKRKTKGFEARAKVNHGSTSLQLSMKGISQGSTTKLLYLVVYPKERMGESVMVETKSGVFQSGFTYSQKVGEKKLTAARLRESLFGTNMSIADVMDNFLNWPTHEFVGEESIGKYDCKIVASKPKGFSNGYTMVKSWVDPKRLVPIRIDKYQRGKLVRVFNVTKLRGSKPTNFKVQMPSKPVVTEIKGSSSKKDKTFPESDFTVEGIKALLK